MKPRVLQGRKNEFECLAVCRRSLVSGIDLLWWTLRVWGGQAIVREAEQPLIQGCCTRLTEDFRA